MKTTFLIISDLCQHCGSWWPGAKGHQVISYHNADIFMTFLKIDIIFVYFLLFLFTSCRLYTVGPQRWHQCVNVSRRAASWGEDAMATSGAMVAKADAVSLEGVKLESLKRPLSPDLNGQDPPEMVSNGSVIKSDLGWCWLCDYARITTLVVQWYGQNWNDAGSMIKPELEQCWLCDYARIGTMLV